MLEPDPRVGWGHPDSAGAAVPVPASPWVAPSSATESGQNGPVTVRPPRAEATPAGRSGLVALQRSVGSDKGKAPADGGLTVNALARTHRSHRGWFHRLMIWMATYPIERNRMPW